MEIWINPACSKCRTALETLDQAGMQYEVRRYLEAPPTAEELTDVLDRLGLEPWEIARMNEPSAAEAGLDTLPRNAEHRAQWISAMTAHPSLIQRPIVTAQDGTTVVGRSPEALEKVIAAERAQ